MDYEIKCHTRFSWGYVYTANERKREIWADNVDALKRKVLAKGLPWEDRNVPKVKPTNIRSTYMGAPWREEPPVPFRLPWCKSNYKRY